MKFKDTYITAAGVFRCCFSLPGDPEEDVEEGATKNCPHCDEEFTLVHKYRRKELSMIWVPSWQLTIKGKCK